MSTPPLPRLLIVDDDAAQMRALCRTLELEGYTASGFTSSKQALAAFRQQPFDLVLTDLTMPEMDGIEFLHAARAVDPHVVGIVITGHGSVDTAVAAMKAGALDYILKPFTLRMIVPVLDRALTVRSLRTENVQLRHAEEMVRNMNAELERSVEERTKQLVETNRELEAFSHSVSHDLRAPLRTIDGFTRMLCDQCACALDDQARGYASRVLNAVKRMEDLIEDLMRLSHVTGAELNYSPVDLSQMVNSIVTELREREPERTLSASVEPELQCVADPQLLRIALENLIGNAWKFTRAVADARIEFGTAPDEPFTYFVRDNGAGFQSDLADEVFAPFRRLHSSAEFPGTGVGLSIVQRIVRRHGGRISATGAVGHGATFYLTLPNATGTDAR
jgi:two-component system, sensor histidine kinase and response regulator